MFCLTPGLTHFSQTPPRNLSAPQYLSHLQNLTRDERIALHKLHDPSVKFTVDDGILQFKSTRRTIRSTLRMLLKGGLSKEEADDILFLPQNVLVGGRLLQRKVLAAHETHLMGIAKRIQKSLYDHAENPVSRDLIRGAAIGLADVPLLFPYVTRAPAGDSVVIIPRGLIIIPMWFAALRRLPRPWNELSYEGESLRRLLGTAGIAIKAMLGHTMVGTNTYMQELMYSEEMRIGFGGDEFARNWLAAPELEEFQKRHETKLCERFVIAHELAHIALGHPEMSWMFGQLSVKDKPELRQWMRAAELEADQLALKVLLDMSPGARGTMVDLKHVFLAHQVADALVVLFLLFHVMEEQAAVSHPPAKQRLRELLESLLTPSESREKFFSEIYPLIERDEDVLREMLITAVVLAKPKVVSHPDVGMRWFT